MTRFILAICFLTTTAVARCPFDELSLGRKLAKFDLPPHAGSAGPAMRAVALLHRYNSSVTLERGPDATVKIDGSPARVVVTGDGEPGNMNDGIYFFHRPTGERSVIKVLRHEIDFTDRDKALAGIERDYETQSFARLIQGVLLCESQGGPRLRGFGPLKGLREGKPPAYVELEELCPDQKARTMKQLMGNAAGRARLAIEIGGKDTVTRMAEMYVKAVRDGILPSDSDYMISEKGEVRWIDGDFWKKADWRAPMREYNPFAENLSELRERLRAISPDVETRFVEGMKRAVRADRALAPADADRFLAVMSF